MSIRRYYKNNYYIIYYAFNKSNDFHFGISIPKKTGKAVIRNKLKRQIKSIIDNNLDIVINNTDYVIIGRNELLKVDFQVMQEELVKLMLKLKQEVSKIEKN